MFDPWTPRRRIRNGHTCLDMATRSTWRAYIRVSKGTDTGLRGVRYVKRIWLAIGYWCDYCGLHSDMEDKLLFNRHIRHSLA